jgi:hypothetical protein
MLFSHDRFRAFMLDILETLDASPLLLRTRVREKSTLYRTLGQIG